MVPILYLKLNGRYLKCQLLFFSDCEKVELILLNEIFPPNVSNFHIDGFIVDIHFHLSYIIGSDLKVLLHMRRVIVNHDNKLPDGLHKTSMNRTVSH